MGCIYRSNNLRRTGQINEIGQLNLVSALARTVNGYLAHYVRVLFMHIFEDCFKLDV